MALNDDKVFEEHTTDGGALSINVPTSKIESSGVETRTLAAPTNDNMRKMICLAVDGGNVTIAATNVGNHSGDTMTFSNAADCIILESAAGKWWVVGGNITPA